MPYIEFKKTYNYWEDKKTYKAGEIVEVDYDHYRELISTGIAAASKLNPVTEELKRINKMSLEELIVYAKEKKISLPSIERKDIIKRTIEFSILRGEVNVN